MVMKKMSRKQASPEAAVHFKISTGRFMDHFVQQVPVMLRIYKETFSDRIYKYMFIYEGHTQSAT